MQHLIPVPGDLLVSFFYPYNSGGWDGFNPWTTHKEFIAADVIRQVFPWRSIGVEMMKNGILPLWNPYAFAGYPLLANLQSALIYPFNILFFVFNDKLAWVLYIMLFPLLGFFGMYLFLRSLNLSKYASLFGGLLFPFVGYFNNWFELGVVTHTGVWLPFILFAINMFSQTKKIKWLSLASVFIFFTLVAGHAQTAVYVLIVSFVYFIFKTIKMGVRSQIVSSWFFLLGAGLAAIQLIPTFELLKFSARNTEQSIEIFHHFQFAWQHIITLFASDFFGNPVTNNFWGENYGEFLLYIGAIGIVFGSIGLSLIKKEKEILFFFLLSIICFLFALPTPLSNALQQLNIPVLGTSIPSRIIFIIQTSFVIIAGFGIDELFSKDKIKKVPIIIIGSVYLLLWIFIFIAPRVMPSIDFIQYLSVAKRNLFLPTAFASLAIVGYMVSKKFSRFAIPIFFLLILVSTIDIWYLTNKNFPFSPSNYFFPNHPLISYLEKNAGNNRVYGYDTARLETNLPTEWRIQSPEGYDPLAIKRYSELLSSTKDNRLPSLIPRSDALFPNTLPKEDSNGKRVMLNLLGTKYILDKQDNPVSTFSPDINRFPESKYNLVWQNGKWQVYENKEALSRAMIFYSSEKVEKDDITIAQLLSKEFPSNSRLILANYPSQAITTNELATGAAITHYSPTHINIQANAKDKGYLFLSDNFYPGWSAAVNNQQVPIFRADYSLRAVEIPKGQSEVTFTYNPLSFKIGFIISMISLVILCVTLFLPKTYYVHKKSH